MPLAASRQSSLQNLAGRAVWLVLLLGHIPALASVLLRFSAAPNVGDALRVLLLAGSQIFFLLKVIDIARLRFPTTRAFWIRFAIIVALLHSGAVWNADLASFDTAVNFALEALPTFAAVLIAIRVLASGIRVLNLLPRTHTLCAQLRLQLSRMGVHRAPAPPSQLAYLTVAPNRAPPIPSRV
ncbi:MAG: hypothetical protein AB7N71_05905 [Phycisphaerae bacterium]